MESEIRRRASQVSVTYVAGYVTRWKARDEERDRVRSRGIGQRSWLVSGDIRSGLRSEMEIAMESEMESEKHTRCYISFDPFGRCTDRALDWGFCCTVASLMDKANYADLCSRWERW